MALATLFGRDEELEWLRSLPDETATHDKTLVVGVGGPAGIGKTSLLQAAIDEFEARGIYCLWGTCSPGSVEAPFKVFSEIFCDALRQAPGPPLDAARSILADGLGRFSGELEYLIDIPDAIDDVFAGIIRLFDAAQDALFNSGRLDEAVETSTLVLDLIESLQDSPPGEYRTIRARAGEMLTFIRELGFDSDQLVWWLHPGSDVYEGRYGRGPVELRSLSPSSRDFVFRDAVKTILRALCSTGPVCLVLDDAHWAGGQLVEFLAELQKFKVQGLVVLVAFRDDESTGDESGACLGALDTLRATLESRALVLQPLRYEAARDYVSRCLDGSDLLREVEDVVERAGGNPLFARELCRFLREETSSSPFRKKTSRDQLPQSLKALLRRRVRVLDAKTLMLLRCCAVLGARFSGPMATAIAAASGVSSPASRMQALVDRGLLVEHADSGDEWRFEFDHGLVRDVVYGDLTLLLRRDLHGSAAQAIETSSRAPFTRDAGVLASHWSRSNFPDRSVWFWFADSLFRWYGGDRFGASSSLEHVFSGENALVDGLSEAARDYLTLWRGDLQRALGQIAPSFECYQQVIEEGHLETLADSSLNEIVGLYGQFMPSDYEPSQRLLPSGPRTVSDALMGRARVHLRRNRWDLAFSDLEDAGSSKIIGGHDLDQAARVRRAYAWALLEHGDAVRAAAILRELENSFDFEQWIVGARVLGDLGRVAFHRGRLHECVELSRRALEYAVRRGDTPGGAILRNNLARAEHLNGRWEIAEMLLAQSVAQSTNVGDLVNSGFAKSNIAKLAFDRRDYDRAAALAEEYIGECARMDYAYGSAVGHVTLARSRLQMGQIAEGRKCMATAMRLHRSSGVLYGIPHALLAVSRFLVKDRRYTQAIRLLESSQEQFGRLGDRFHESSATFLAGVANLDLGDARRGEKLLGRVATRAARLDFPLLATRLSLLARDREIDLSLPKEVREYIGGAVERIDSAARMALSCDPLG